jgi:glutathione peroxidase
MKFKTLLLSLIFGLFAFQSFTKLPKNFTGKFEKQSIYDFKVKDINGKTFDFETLKGKKIMIVNTASQCMLASQQFSELEKLYQRYKNDNFVIVAFPSSDFMDCEVSSNDDIKNTYEENFNISFPLMGKVTVKGNDTHDLFKFLMNKKQNKVQGCGILWNFQKFLIGENGDLEKIVNPKVSPSDSEIVTWISKQKSIVSE